MTFIIKCPGCGKRSEASTEEIGHQTKCPDCGKEFEIRNPKLIPCPDCFGLVSKRAAICPHCGAPLASDETPGVIVKSGDGSFDTVRNERVIIHCHPSWLNYLGAIAVGILVCLFVVGLHLLLDKTVFDRVEWLANCRKPISVGIVCCLILYAACILLRIWINTLLTRYRITNFRIVVTKGWIAKTQTEIWIKDMRGANLLQNAWQRIIGIGHISIGTAATAETEIRLIGIRRPQAVVNQINALRH